MKRKILLSPLDFLLIYLFVSLCLHFFLPIKHIVGPYRFFGAVLILFGGAINIWTDFLFKKNKTTVKPDNTPSAFIEDGPFRLSRHPMYLGFVFILLGIAVLLGSLSSFLAPIMMFITLEQKFIPFEEKNMEQKFGKQYVEYKHRVRRWIFFP